MPTMRPVLRVVLWIAVAIVLLWIALVIAFYLYFRFVGGMPTRA